MTEVTDDGQVRYDKALVLVLAAETLSDLLTNPRRPGSRAYHIGLHGRQWLRPVESTASSFGTARTWDLKKIDKDCILSDFLHRLQRGKHLSNYQFVDESYLVSVDGSEYFSSEKGIPP